MTKALKTVQDRNRLQKCMNGRSYHRAKAVKRRREAMLTTSFGETEAHDQS